MSNDQQTIDSSYWGERRTREFEALTDYQKPRVLEFLAKLPTLDDRTFVLETASAIHSAAIMSNAVYPMGADDDFKTDVCGDESRTRMARDGHDSDCQGDSLYSRAYRMAFDLHGGIDAPHACTCSKGAKAVASE